MRKLAASLEKNKDLILQIKRKWDVISLMKLSEVITKIIPNVKSNIMILYYIYNIIYVE